MTNQFVEAARSYKGVRWRHRGRSKWSLDCAGLVIRSYADCGVKLPDRELYGREPHNDGLIESITEALGAPVKTGLVAMADLRIGDVIVIRYDIYPHHVMIVSDCSYAAHGLNVIHADGHNGRVVEHRMDDRLAGQVTHVFRRPV